MRQRSLLGLGMLAASLCGALGGGRNSQLPTQDWPQFRGPGGLGIATAGRPPVKWSESENLAWKLALPGTGASSPVIVGDRILVTSWSGPKSYPAGGLSQPLKRHINCIQSADGTIVWKRILDAEPNPDPYEGFLEEHG